MEFKQGSTRVAMILIAWGAAAGCGREDAETPPGTISDGVLAVVGGAVRKLTDHESATLCRTQYCEPNYVYSITFGRKQPTDDKQDYSRAKLRLPEAWKISEGAPEIIVAVIDSGTDLNHPDLKANIHRDPVTGEAGYDFVNDRPDAQDDQKHGTHCSGIIAAARNGMGTIGVAPRVRVMPVKFLGADGSGDTDHAIQAIDYAVAHGARILSNSWGGGGKSTFLEEAISRARAAGVIVVAAAGNSSSDLDATSYYPASFPGVISVASTDSADKLSSFSSFGKINVPIAAPGSNIFSTLLGGTYGELSGTSMAAPQVAGAIALALSVRPTLTEAEVTTKLCGSATPILKDKIRCGRLDVKAFLDGI